MTINSLNRTQQPPLQSIDNIYLNEVIPDTLQNGLPIYLLPNKAHNVVILQFEFDAGSWYEKQNLVSVYANRMLKEGTKSYPGRKLLDTIEYYGSELFLSVNKDTATIGISCLARYLSPMLPILKSILTESTFCAEELDIILKNAKQRLMVNLEKTDFLASRLFSIAYFGENHPYCFNPKLEDYNALTADILKDYYQKYYTVDNCKLYIAGNFTDKNVEEINALFGQRIRRPRPDITEVKHPTPLFKPQKLYEHHKGAEQAAIKMGCPLFSRNHPHFNEMYVVNTILGGYYGSRLMKNLREDKGLTYGIYSVLAHQKHGGYFYATTDVNADQWQLAVEEIYKEIDQLQSELIDDEELTTVKNYMLGRLLAQTDGLFNRMKLLITFEKFGLSAKEVQSMTNCIKEITPQQIMATSQRYLQPNNMLEVVVGA